MRLNLIIIGTIINKRTIPRGTFLGNLTIPAKQISGHRINAINHQTNKQHGRNGLNKHKEQNDPTAQIIQLIQPGAEPQSLSLDLLAAAGTQLFGVDVFTADGATIVEEVGEVVGPGDVVDLVALQLAEDVLLLGYLQVV